MRKFTILLFSVITILSANAQKGIVIDESFEEDFPPTGWTTFEDGNGTRVWEKSSFWPKTGSYCATAPWENTGGTNSKWLVTPQIPAGANTLTFYACDNYEPSDYSSRLHVKVSSGSQTNTGDFNLELTITEAEAGHGVMTQYTVDISDYSATPIYVAFVMEDEDGDDWFIDDVKIETVVDNDIGITNVLPPFVIVGKTVSPRVIVKNYSGEPENNITISLNDGTGYSSNYEITEALSPGEEIEVIMDDWSPIEGDYILTATATYADDIINTDNNTFQKNVHSGNYGANAYAISFRDITFGSVDGATGEYTQLSPVDEMPPIRSEEYDGNYIYRIDNQNNIGIVGPAGEYMKLGQVSNSLGQPYGLSYDPQNHIMYLMGYEAPYSHLYTLNLTDFTANEIGAIMGTIPYVHHAADGYLYGINILTESEEKILKIDPSTAQIVQILPSGINYHTAAFDYNYIDNRLYGFIVDTNAETSIYGWFDLSTGLFTQISETPQDRMVKTYTIVEDFSTDVIDNHSESMFTVYPNPADNFCRIYIPDNYGSAVVKITNLNGQLVYIQTLDANMRETIINSNRFASGTYNISIITKDNTQSGKLIVKHR